MAQLQRETDQTKQDLVAQAAAVQELEELHLNRTVRVPPSGAVHRHSSIHLDTHSRAGESSIRKQLVHTHSQIARPLNSTGTTTQSDTHTDTDRHAGSHGLKAAVTCEGPYIETAHMFAVIAARTGCT